MIIKPATHRHRYSGRHRAVAEAVLPEDYTDADVFELRAALARDDETDDGNWYHGEQEKKGRHHWEDLHVGG